MLNNVNLESSIFVDLRIETVFGKSKKNVEFFDFKYDKTDKIVENENIDD